MARNIYCKAEDTLKSEFTEDKTIKRNGKEVKIEDYVESHKADTEIYSLLDKYGAIEKIPVDTQIIESDLSAIKNLRDIKEADRQVQYHWNNLPLEERAKFGNNIYEYKQNALKYYQNLNKAKAEEMAKAEKLANEQAQAQQTTTGGNNA